MLADASRESRASSLSLQHDVTGGPKLRKWYGEGDLPLDGGNTIVKNMPEPEDIAHEDIERDAILVTDADSPTGEQVVLQLILARYINGAVNLYIAGVRKLQEQHVCTVNSPTLQQKSSIKRATICVCIIVW